VKAKEYERQVVQEFGDYGELAMKAARAAIYAHESGRQRRKDKAWDTEVLKGLRAARRALKRWMDQVEP
jgi:hypothetical protein